MLRDIAELKSQIFHLRTDVARSSSTLKRTMIVTGVSVVLAILLATVGFSAGLLPGISGAHESGNANDKLMAMVSAELEGVRGTMKSLTSRLDRQPEKPAEKTIPGDAEKPAARLGCSNLPPDIKAGAVDFLIQFQVGSAKILPTSEATLDTIAKMLALAPDRCVLIEGHTDATGKAEKNMVLSRERANSVAKYIADKAGIERNNLVPIGKGSSSPLAGLDPNDPQNRRVVFQVVTGSALAVR
jgi:outer membrane protein OmpA-like peptidoglycan-associated protein